MRSLIRLVISLACIVIIILGVINIANIYNEPLSYMEKNSKTPDNIEYVNIARSIASSALEATENYEEQNGKEPEKFSEILTFELKDDSDKTPIVTAERKDYIQNIEGIDSNELVVTFKNGIQAYYKLDDAEGFTFYYEPPYGL